LSKKQKNKSSYPSQAKGFQDFSKLLISSKRVLLSTHALPDGDGLGAELALYHYLKRIKKACRVYNPDRLPKRYHFLDPKRSILLGPREVEIWDTFDLWVIVDTNDPRRLGPLWSELSLRAKKIFFLDHHPDIQGNEQIQYPPHATVLSDLTSSSIGELLYHLFQELQLTKITKDVGLGLYVSVMTDTNSFRYARTTPIAHTIAAEIISLGINPEEIYQLIYSSKELSHLKLLGHALQNVKVTNNGNLAWIEIDLKTRKKFSASADDTQSFLNLLLLLKDAEVVCFFREEDNNDIRVSIKSKGRVTVNQVAMELGGGGHQYAAGLSLSASLEKTVDAVIKRLSTIIDNYQKFGK